MVKCTWLHTTNGKLMCGRYVRSKTKRNWKACQNNCPSAIELYNNTLVYGNFNIYGVIPTENCKVGTSTNIKDSRTLNEKNVDFEKNMTYWCCRDVSFDPKGIPDVKKASCSPEICKNLPPKDSLTENNLVMFTTILSLSVVFICLAMLAVVAYYIKTRKDIYFAEHHPTDLEEIVTEEGMQETWIKQDDFRDSQTTSGTVTPDILVNGLESKSIDLSPICNIRKYLYNGDIEQLDPNRPLNEQLHAIPYSPKLELDRSLFTVFPKLLGKGNFGKVYKGEANGLFYPDSKTPVAIKTVNNTSSKSEVNCLLCEAKILSNISLHFNLVNMLGACSTSPDPHQDIWLLLEFCEQGNLKDFLKQYRKEFERSFSNNPSVRSKVQDRLLIQWCYDIVKGMEYLSGKGILHGDLAARNILLSKGDTKNKLIARITDFGLSKAMYKNKYYKKIQRQYVPWKWIAFEYLENGMFQIKSDVWSYGVVAWEIFSLGEDPYESFSYDELFRKLSNGYYLPCPKRAHNITSWQASDFYKSLAEQCFQRQVHERSSFAELSKYIKGMLRKDEVIAYEKEANSYLKKCSFLLDENTRKRLSAKGSKRGVSLNV